MDHQIELGYLVLEVPDPESLTPVLAEVVGLVPGEPTPDGTTWRNDERAHRLLVTPGPANDAVAVGVEAQDADAFDATVARLQAIGADVAEGTPDEVTTRRVGRLARTRAPWGIDVEVVLELADAGTPFSSALVPGGFLTDGVGLRARRVRHHRVRRVARVPHRRPRLRPVGLARDGDRARHRARGALLPLQQPPPHDRPRTAAVRPPAASAPHHVRAQRARRRRRRVRPRLGERAADPERARAATTTTGCSASTCRRRPGSRSRSATAPG